MRNIFIRTIWKLAVFCGMGATLCACNDDLVNGLRTDYPDEDFAYHKNHVLWIVVDGASGTAVREANNDRRVMTLKGMMEKHYTRLTVWLIPVPTRWSGIVWDGKIC